MSAALSTIVHKVVTLAQKGRSRSLSEQAPAALPASNPARPVSSRGVLYTVPIVLVSTLAISLNLAAPAQAAAHVKKPLKAMPSTAVPTTVASTVAAAAPTQVAPAEYTVADGDTISGIAARFGVASAAVLARNGLGWSSLIFPGQVLNITDTVAPAAAPAAPAGPAAAGGQHTVVTGDTIGAIAAANGVSVDALLGANGLTRSSIIFPDQVILLPGSAAATPAPAPAASAAPAADSHTIVSGDTIGAIAATAGVSVQQVLDANGLGWSSIIYPGQVLSVPQSASMVAVVDAVPITPIATEPTVYVTAGVATEMSAEMRQNAQTIVSVGRAAGVPEQGLVIALAAAAQESGLRNVTYGDRDSLGLFQQRPSSGWGSAEQVQDPIRASQAFFGGAGNPNPGVTRGLLDISGWDAMSVTDAAQAVQISAYPNHYAKWETSARLWLTQIG